MEELFQLVKIFKEAGMRTNINLISIEKFNKLNITEEDFIQYCNENNIKIEFIDSAIQGIRLPNYIINILD